MIIDISDPKFDAKELFKQYCESDKIFINKFPENCMNIGRLCKWILYNGEIPDFSPRNEGENLEAGLIIKVWLKAGFISYDHMGDDCGPFEWYKINGEIK